jgi:hypothetical protein
VGAGGFRDERLDPVETRKDAIGVGHNGEWTLGIVEDTSVIELDGRRVPPATPGLRRLPPRTREDVNYGGRSPCEVDLLIEHLLTIGMADRHRASPLVKSEFEGGEDTYGGR